jgi:hypothetical protein
MKITVAEMPTENRRILQGQLVRPRAHELRKKPYGADVPE